MNQDYLKMLKQKFGLILLAGLILAGLTFVWVSRRPATFEGVITITVAKQGTTEKDQSFNYDDYYNLQASGYLVDLISGWLSSPNIVKQIFDQVNLPVPATTSKQLGKVFLYNKPVSLSSVLIVTTKTQTATEAQKILVAARSIVQTNISNYQEQAQLSRGFQALITDPFIIENKTRPLEQSLIVGLAGLILAGLALVVREYIRQ